MMYLQGRTENRMRTFPIMLDLRGKLAVVIGAGPVGIRKARSLVVAEARVRLLAERVDADRAPAGVEVLERPYEESALAGAFLVFACTDDAALNSRIARDARQAGALVNVADTPTECDFYLPATTGDGDVIVAIGTGGASPGMAAWLKGRLRAVLPERVGEFAALLNDLRSELKSRVTDVSSRMAVMKRMADDETYRQFIEAGPDAVRGKLQALLGAQKEN
jgi:precorrin-2 dehydrogenase/sirohydrochlorin ferrochelatase